MCLWSDGCLWCRDCQWYCRCQWSNCCHWYLELPLVGHWRARTSLLYWCQVYKCFLRWCLPRRCHRWFLSLLWQKQECFVPSVFLFDALNFSIWTWMNKEFRISGPHPWYGRLLSRISFVVFCYRNVIFYILCLQSQTHDQIENENDHNDDNVNGFDLLAVLTRNQ